LNENKTVQSIERAFKILEVIRDKGKVGIRELSKLTGLSPSTVQRLVFTLEKTGYLFREPFTSKCRLSHKFFYLANEAFYQSRLPSLAVPFLEKLSLELNETIELATIDKMGYIICVAKVSFSREAKTPVVVGNRFPPHSNALGKAILAYLPEEDKKRVYKNLPLEAYTPYTITDLNTLDEELIRVREKGYAVSKKEQYGSEIMVSAPIIDHLGIVGAFGINSATNRVTDDKIPQIGNIILRVSKEISYCFGWQPQS
jgi:DNA-binding IclR family transcriptional regulator